MEIASLILEYLSVLAWPSVVLLCVLAFRRQVRHLIASLVDRGEKLELEVGGQRPSVKLAERVVERAVAEASEESTRKGGRSCKEISEEARNLLKVLPYIRAEELRLLKELPLTTREVVDNVRYWAPLARLRELGLAQQSMEHGAALTTLGHRVVSALGGNGVWDAMHKIGRSTEVPAEPAGGADG